MFSSCESGFKKRLKRLWLEVSGSTPSTATRAWVAPRVLYIGLKHLCRHYFKATVSTI